MQKYDFSELIKNEHKKLQNIINVLNKEVCSSERWNFLQRKTQLVLPKNTGEIENPISGRIEAIIIDGEKYNYHDDFESFFVNAQPSNTYSFYEDKILFPIFNQDKNVEILYYTNNFAKDFENLEKLNLEYGTDQSLIPDLFAEPILVYGACMRLKGNPQHIRFNYWLSMYKEALTNMKSRISNTVDYAPKIKMHRK